MKRIVLIFTIICLLATLFVPVAFADGGIEITSVTYASTGNRFTLNVQGMGDAGGNISLLVKNEDGMLKAMEQCKADETNTFRKEVKIDVSGDEKSDSEEPMMYTVSVRSYQNNYAEYTLPLFTEEAKDKITQKFNNAAEDAEMIQYIEEYNKAFGFNMTYFDAKKEEIAGSMLSEKNVSAFTSDNMGSRFNLSVIKAYLFNSDFGADRTKIIEYPLYSTILRFETGIGGAASLYQEYKEMLDSLRKKVNVIAFRKENVTKTPAEWKENLFMAVTAVVFEENKDDLSAIKSFLQKHNDWFALEKLDSLSAYKWSQLLKGIISESVPNNKDDFVKLCNKYLENELGSVSTVTKPSVGGSGGGGGTGSGGNYVKPVVDGTVASGQNVPSTAAVVFGDLEGYDWARGAIEKLAAMNIINGKTNERFVPGDNITREEFSKILALAYGLYDENAQCSFADTERDKWSYPYIASVYKAGIVSGYPDGSFGAEKTITREEMAVMLCRVLVRQGKLAGEYTSYSEFKDFSSISDFAVNSVLTLCNQGIISGDDTGFFRPQNGATRAEVCKMVYNSMIYCNDIDGKAVTVK